MESLVTTRGRFTVPKALLKHLRLRPGDRLRFFVHPDGSVVLLPKQPVTAVKSIVKARGSTTIEDQVIAASATRSAASRRRR